MFRTAVRSDGALVLGDDARRLGFEPGALVDVIVTRAGSLILALNDETAIEAPYKALPRVRRQEPTVPAIAAPPCTTSVTEAGMRVAAGRIGVTVEYYRGQVQRGYRWCSGHKDWEPREHFGPHKRRGLNSVCREFSRTAAREYARAHYVPVAQRRSA